MVKSLFKVLCISGNMRDTIIELIFKTFKHSFYLLHIIANNTSLETLEDLFQELKRETETETLLLSVALQRKETLA